MDPRRVNDNFIDLCEPLEALNHIGPQLYLYFMLLIVEIEVEFKLRLLFLESLGIRVHVFLSVSLPRTDQRLIHVKHEHFLLPLLAQLDTFHQHYGGIVVVADFVRLVQHVAEAQGLYQLHVYQGLRRVLWGHQGERIFI